MKSLSLLFFALAAFSSFAQNLPNQWSLLTDQHMITIGKVEDDGLYDKSIIREYYLEFDQSNYWSLLTANYGTENEVSATLTVDGITYPQVGVSFKGQTSYLQVNGDKKSFSIKMDSFIPDQDLMGYQTLNLNNCFGDASFLREFMYLHLIKKHIPAAKCSFVHLFINGQDWGLYPNVQQMNKDYLEEWFLSNDGTLWRADSPTSTAGGGGPGGGGPQWGDGTAALNYNGTADTDYSAYYTLKSTASTDPWQLLINTTDVLENTAIANLEAQLPTVMDVDRALWLLASEIAFGDDDSYVYKGKMDYYAYWEVETGRLTPLEYDGNSVLGNQANNWSPFYHADNANYPLLNKLMQVPAYRQRYLAHVRTILEEALNLTTTQAFIDEWSDFIDAQVQNDPKKLTTYNAFVTEQTTLQTRLTARRNAMNNAEVNTVGAAISGVKMISAGGEWSTPLANEPITIEAIVSSTDGIGAVNCHYSTELVGNFTVLPMTSNGTSYQAQIPGLSAGTVVRFYIEAIESNTAGTRSYQPVGAEHDVYYFNTMPAFAASSDIVINELMADNGTTMADDAGEYDDWIELYNKGNETVDLTGYYITDNDWNLTKFEIPAGTMMAPDSYLILWADEDGLQGPLHANFKLSSSGETVTLLNSEGLIADQVIYTQQAEDLAFARNPNGTGAFMLQPPTFSVNNESEVSIDEIDNQASWTIYPNPASTVISIQVKDLTRNVYDLKISDLTGRVIMFESAVVTSENQNIQLNISDLARGSYLLSLSSDEQLLTKMIVKN